MLALIKKTLLCPISTKMSLWTHSCRFAFFVPFKNFHLNCHDISTDKTIVCSGWQSGIPNGWNVSCLFLVSECAFYDGEVNCFGIASPPDVSLYISIMVYFFNVVMSTSKKQYFTTSCHFSSFQLRKTCVNFATSFTFVIFFPPFFPTNWFFWHTHPAAS